MRVVLFFLSLQRLKKNIMITQIMCVYIITQYLSQISKYFLTLRLINLQIYSNEIELKKNRKCLIKSIIQTDTIDLFPRKKKKKIN